MNEKIISPQHNKIPSAIESESSPKITEPVEIELSSPDSVDRMQINNENLDEKHEIVRLEKIHFLIHPGFTSPELLERYVNEAREIAKRPDELLCLISQFNRSTIQRLMGSDNKIMRAMHQMKEMLHGRLMILSDDQDIGMSKVYSKDRVAKTILLIRRIASARGFEFDSDTLSEAFGEYLSLCVAAGVARLNEAAGFSNKTTLRPELSDGQLYLEGKTKIHHSSPEEIQRAVDEFTDQLKLAEHN